MTADISRKGKEVKWGEKSQRKSKQTDFAAKALTPTVAADLAEEKRLRRVCRVHSVLVHPAGPNKTPLG